MSEKRRSTDRKRKRGGQPGNINALSHGFYSRMFKEPEVEDLALLESLVVKDLGHEITMLRVATRRLFIKSEEVDETRDLTGVLNALGLAAMRLARIMGDLENRLQKAIGKEPNPAVEALNQALEEIAKELGGEKGK